MGRRVTSGVVGGSGLGNINVVSSTITTTTANGDLTLDPNGSGVVKFDSDALLSAQNDLRFGDSDTSNYVAIQAPTTVATNYTLTLPDAVAGSSGLALISDTNGVLSWAAAGAALTDNTTDSGTNYITFTTSTSGSLSAARVSTTKLTFQPSTGTLVSEGPVVFRRTENVQTGNYTLALTDRNIAVAMNNSSAATVTVPTNASVPFPVGSIIHITRVNTGSVTLAGAGGVTLSKTGLLGSNEEVILRKRATDSWLVVDMVRTGTVATGGTTTTSGGYQIHSFTTTGASSFVVG